MKIRIFVTGGTFDKSFDEINGKLSFKESHLPEMLKTGKCRLDVEVSTLMLVDSLEMTDAGRNLIVENCRKTPEDKIIITHGTDTMVETAKYIAKSTIANKIIILTGATVPYKFEYSDGLFNLGSSLAYVQFLPPGVYISMHGKYFNWDNVRKNREIGEFEVIDKK